MVFYSICGTLNLQKPLKNTAKHMFFCKITFPENASTLPRFLIYCFIILDPCWHYFLNFFGIEYCIDFELFLDPKWLPKWTLWATIFCKFKQKRRLFVFLHSSGRRLRPVLGAIHDPNSLRTLRVTHCCPILYEI